MRLKLQWKWSRGEAGQLKILFFSLFDNRYFEKNKWSLETGRPIRQSYAKTLVLSRITAQLLSSPTFFTRRYWIDSINNYITHNSCLFPWIFYLRRIFCKKDIKLHYHLFKKYIHKRSLANKCNLNHPYSKRPKGSKKLSRSTHASKSKTSEIQGFHRSDKKVRARWIKKVVGVGCSCSWCASN